MIIFYIILTVISAALLITDAVLLYMERIKSFGLERKLFKLKGKDIPIEMFLPQNITMALGALVWAGIAGIFCCALSIRWYFSLPTVTVMGMLLCFGVQYYLMQKINKYKDKAMPLGDAAQGADGRAVEKIDGENGDYGLIEFEYNDEIFRAPAMSVFGSIIPEFEKVVVLFEENGFYFVQSIKEVYEELGDDE